MSSKPDPELAEFIAICRRLPNMARGFLRYMLMKEMVRRPQPKPTIGRFLRHMPFPLRLGLLHGVLTLGTLATFPLPPQIPALAIPVVWGASFATALVLLTFFYLFIPRRMRLI